MWLLSGTVWGQRKQISLTLLQPDNLSVAVKMTSSFSQTKTSQFFLLTGVFQDSLVLTQDFELFPIGISAYESSGEKKKLRPQLMHLSIIHIPVTDCVLNIKRKLFKQTAHVFTFHFSLLKCNIKPYLLGQILRSIQDRKARDLFVFSLTMKLRNIHIFLQIYFSFTNLIKIAIKNKSNKFDLFHFELWLLWS